jgi:hypothetical protein
VRSRLLAAKASTPTRAGGGG